MSKVHKQAMQQHQLHKYDQYQLNKSIKEKLLVQRIRIVCQHNNIPSDYQQQQQ